MKVVKDLIKLHRIQVFSKSYCPFCEGAKQLLKSRKVEFNVMELDKEKDGVKIQAYLKEFSGQGTVPNIWIESNHIGGFDNLRELYNSKK